MKYKGIMNLISGKRGITLLPFFVGTLYTYYKFKTMDPINAVLLLLALIFMEEGIAGLSGYFIKDKTPPTEAEDLFSKYEKRKKKLDFNLVFFLLYSVLSIVLSIRSGFIVLLLLIILIVQGTLYRGGPIPIVKTHRSEITTGFTLGLLIPLTSVLIHIYDAVIKAWIYRTRFHFEADLKSMGMVLIITIPLVTSLINLILTDNIIDMAVDGKKGRFTVPILIGKDNALLLFNFLHIAGVLSVVIAVLTKSLPVIGILMILPYSLVFKNARIFSGRSHKERGNLLAQENFIAITFGIIIVILLGMYFNL